MSSLLFRKKTKVYGMILAFLLAPFMVFSSSLKGEEEEESDAYISSAEAVGAQEVTTEEYESDEYFSSAEAVGAQEVTTEESIESLNSDEGTDAVQAIDTEEMATAGQKLHTTIESPAQKLKALYLLINQSTDFLFGVISVILILLCWPLRSLGFAMGKVLPMLCTLNFILSALARTVAFFVLQSKDEAQEAYRKETMGSILLLDMIFFYIVLAIEGVVLVANGCAASQKGGSGASGVSEDDTSVIGGSKGKSPIRIPFGWCGMLAYLCTIFVKYYFGKKEKTILPQTKKLLNFIAGKYFAKKNETPKKELQQVAS